MKRWETRRKHKIMDRGRGAHSESLAMTFDKILFQSTLDLNLLMIRYYDCTSNEV